MLSTLLPLWAWPRHSDKPGKPWSWRVGKGHLQGGTYDLGQSHFSELTSTQQVLAQNTSVSQGGLELNLSPRSTLSWCSRETSVGPWFLSSGLFILPRTLLFHGEKKKYDIRAPRIGYSHKSLWWMWEGSWDVWTMSEGPDYRSDARTQNNLQASRLRVSVRVGTRGQARVMRGKVLGGPGHTVRRPETQMSA